VLLLHILVVMDIAELQCSHMNHQHTLTNQMDMYEVLDTSKQKPNMNHPNNERVSLMDM